MISSPLDLQLNSKIITFLFIFFISACGVKKYPKAPDSKKLPDIVDSYKFKSDDLIKKKQKKKKVIKENQNNQN